MRDFMLIMLAIVHTFADYVTYRNVRQHITEYSDYKNSSAGLYSAVA